ncbi:hypothetical protein ACFWWC_35940 [Streptomyces sp. NPDC058642]|uniref:hypothetical protein n=1 Tax=Streptomyces sp. NPDC058642 TaxID=3346572 RepID=UPI00364D6332
MRNRLKLGAVALAAAFGGVIAVGSPAAASDDEFWTRSCGSKYYAFSDKYTSWTKKYSGGDCAGDAWVRIKVNGKWQGWKHAPGMKTIENSAGNTELSEHKGCADCKVYLLIP